MVRTYIFLSVILLSFSSQFLSCKVVGTSSDKTLHADFVGIWQKQHKTLDNPDSKKFREDQKAWKQYELQYMKNVKVILSDGRQAENRTIFRWKDSINYSYAKIY